MLFEFVREISCIIVQTLLHLGKVYLSVKVFQILYSLRTTVAKLLSKEYSEPRCNLLSTDVTDN